MKKRILLLVLIVAFLMPLATAALNETLEESTVGKAQVWLDKQVKESLNILPPDELALSILALSYDDVMTTEGKSILLNKTRKGECWPAKACDAKTTSIVMITLNALGENVDVYADWLMSQKMTYTATGVTWILQIDSDDATNCTVRYDSKSYDINLKKDKTYEWAKNSTSSPCLSITNGNYWIEVAKTKECLSKQYEVSCTNPAIVSFPWKSGNVLYVPSESQSTPATVSIKTICIQGGNACNYDATLWTAYALQKSAKEYNLFIPYLVDQKENNQQYMPDAFLFMLMNRDENAANLLSTQGKEGYWSDVGGFGKYYDTALAAGAIKDYYEMNFTKAKEWLIKENQEGSWGTEKTKKRDTAMILSFIWPSETRIIPPTNDCENLYKYYCRESCDEDEEEFDASCGGALNAVCCKPKGAVEACEADTDCKKPECSGQWLNDLSGKCEIPESSCRDYFDNDADGKVDEEDSDCRETCSDKAGKECPSDEKCTEEVVSATDTEDCCLADCVPEEETCAEQGGIVCRTGEKCDTDTVIVSGDECCLTNCKTKTNILPYIIIAVILALGAAAYFLYKKGFFSNFSLSKKKITPAIPPYGQMVYRPAVRPLTAYPAQPQSQQQQPGQPVNVNIKFQPPKTLAQQRFSRESKSELDETLKKLKKLSEK